VDTIWYLLDTNRRGDHVRQETEVNRLKRAGVDAETLGLAIVYQDAQKRCGVGMQSIADICAGKPPPQKRKRGADVVPLSDRQLRRRGLAGQAALILHTAAEQEQNPETAAELRRLADETRVVSQPVQLEFNFWRGNFSVSDHYLDAVMQRLKTSEISRGLEAKNVLMGLMRFVGKLDPEVKIDSQDQLAEYCGMQRANVTRALAVLEQVGAIKRVKSGRRTRIYITPEGVFRGAMDKHAETVAAYANVVKMPGQER